MTDIRWTDGNPSIAYGLEGTGERNVIAIHEMGGNLETFTPLVPLLDRDFRLLRYDQRGAGLSEKPRQPFAFADHVDDLERVIAQAGIAPPFYFLGLAAGCAIAVAFAHKHPGDVLKLALCAPALSASADRRVYFERRVALAASEGMRSIAEDVLQRSYPSRYRDRDPQRFAQYRARFLAADPIGYGNINMAFIHADSEAAARALRAPVLLLGGEYDALRPPDDVREMIRDIPHAQCEFIDSGHIMPLHAPETMAARLREFLQP